jgi:hypothetical protein
MAELFDGKGHLTEETFEKLQKDYEFDTLERLEIAEHLSFCDECILSYTNTVTHLHTPPEGICNKTMLAIRRRDTFHTARGYTTMAVAACLAALFWLSGVFAPYQSERVNARYLSDAADKVSQQTSQLGNRVSMGLDYILNWNQKEGVKYEKK